MNRLDSGVSSAPLVTWDEEVVRRAGARTPEDGIEGKPTP